VASIEGVNFVVFYHPSASEIFGWSGLIRGMDSWGFNLVVFYSPGEPEIFGWSGLIKGGLLYYSLIDLRIYLIQ
jgi:hypothetical protein